MEFIFWILIVVIICLIGFLLSSNKIIKTKEEEIEELKNISDELGRRCDKLMFDKKMDFDKNAKTLADYDNLIDMFHDLRNENNKLINENYLLKKEINDRTGFKYNNKTF